MSRPHPRLLAVLGGASLLTVALAGCGVAAPRGSSDAAGPPPTAASGAASPTAEGPGTPGPRTPTGPVPAGELRRLAVPAAGFDQDAFALTVAAMGDAIDPPTYSPGRPSLPVRVADRGSRPAGDADDTVYVGCHTSARNGADKYPCNVLIRNVQPGDAILATTDAGTLTYTVTHTRSIPYADFAGDEETWRVEPRRLVFVMCDIVDGRGNQANWVIYADLA